MKVLLLALSLLAVPACDKAASDHKAGGAPTGGDRFAISVTKAGFEPTDLAIPAARPVTLVFERKTDETCAKEVVLEVDGTKIEKELPLNTPVELAVTFPKAGKLTYACGMDMVHGTLTVQ